MNKNSNPSAVKERERARAIIQQSHCSITKALTFTITSTMEIIGTK
jgi:hypothetical protein